MSEITKEEISLCRQIAEKYRKEIKRRQYFYNSHRRGIQWSGEDGQAPASWAIPFWTISDCLKWLKERYDDVSIGSIENEWDAQVDDAYDKVHHPEFLEDIRGKTPLEVCLKVILIVVEEKK